MVDNIYQQAKVGNDLMAMARRIFKEPEFGRWFSVIAVNRVQDASGKDQSIKVEMNVPDNPKAMHTMHISVINYTAAKRGFWDPWLRAQAKEAVKRMRMMRSRAREVRDLDQL